MKDDSHGSKGRLTNWRNSFEFHEIPTVHIKIIYPPSVSNFHMIERSNKTPSYLQRNVRFCPLSRFACQGVIHPLLTIREAKELMTSAKPKARDRSGRVQVKRRLSQFRNFVRTTIPDWTSDEQEMMRSALLQLAEEIARYEAVPIFNGQDPEIGITAAVVKPAPSPMNGNLRLVSPVSLC